jgi:hypothetical protein
MGQNRLPTWVSVVIAGVIIVGILAAAAVGGTAYFIYRHVNAISTPRENAETEFKQARSRFVGQQPLIELKHGGEPVFHRDQLKPKAEAEVEGRKIEAIRVMAYDPGARKLVRVSIPFWLLRLAPSKRLSFLDDNGIDFDSDNVHLTLEDLERRGPGLIIDQEDRHGSHVLVWAE